MKFDPKNTGFATRAVESAFRRGHATLRQEVGIVPDAERAEIDADGLAAGDLVLRDGPVAKLRPVGRSRINSRQATSMTRSPSSGSSPVVSVSNNTERLKNIGPR